VACLEIDEIDPAIALMIAAPSFRRGGSPVGSGPRCGRSTT
jgi:hypothetical protein